MDRLARASQTSSKKIEPRTQGAEFQRRSTGAELGFYGSGTPLLQAYMRAKPTRNNNGHGLQKSEVVLGVL